MAEPIVPGYSDAGAVETRLARLVEAGFGREEIGRSRQGRPIELYSFPPSPAGDEGEGVLLVSLIHPMEWIGLEMNLALLETWSALGDGSLGPPPVRSIPVLNPDGYARIEGALRRRAPRWVRGTAAGVDLNRNFPQGWKAWPEWLAPGPLYHPGAAPFSEPEARALAAAAGRLRPGVFFSFHSFGRWIFYPPSFSRRPWPASERHRRIALAALRAGRAPYRTGQLGRWSPAFRALGTEIDFLHHTTGALSYLVEISRGGFARWGLGRIAYPFFAFNPPEPEREIEILRPVLLHIVRAALRPDDASSYSEEPPEEAAPGLPSG